MMMQGEELKRLRCEKKYERTGVFQNSLDSLSC